MQAPVPSPVTEVLAIRSFVVVCSCALLLLGAMKVGATEAAARPEIDRFPSLVSHQSSVRVAGHVQGRPAGVVVNLQRRFPHSDSWRTIASSKTDGSGAVSFRFDAPRFTAKYKLTTRDARSEIVRIAVRPHLSLKVRRANVMQGAKVVVRGNMYPPITGRRALLEWKVDGQWKRIDRVRLGDGDFRRAVRIRRHGHRRIRITFRHDEYNARARSADLVRVHRRSQATWYGPGFFGNRTACGQRYHRDLLGVAHRSLPCGTIVSALYKGRTVPVPVVDRGPYGHADWDLTEEAAQRLGFSGRDQIGVLRRS